MMAGTGAKSVSSKPNFGFAAKKTGGGAFAKPAFQMMGSKKVTGGLSGGAPLVLNKGPGGPPKITLKKRQNREDEFINQEFA